MHEEEFFDFIIVGSGFGGSVSALRLREKGYSVLVLEQGKRYGDDDFPRTNWEVWNYLWIPALRCFGFLKLDLLPGVFVMHGTGVGGGSLGYANVLVEPDERLFKAPAWNSSANWKEILKPHYQTAKQMLGVTQNPRLWEADEILRDIAEELGRRESFQPTQVGVLFGEEEGVTVPDPYFGGRGPERTTCNHCGGCMVGCRYNAKNTLVKNYLYLAEQEGVVIQAESTVRDIIPFSSSDDEGARYKVEYESTTAFIRRPTYRVKARSVVVSAGAIGTMKLLFRCRDVTGSLPAISPRLGDNVRTNNEEFLGAVSRKDEVDYSRGVSIPSVFQADRVTHIEPVHFPAGSSFLLRVLASPMIPLGTSVINSILQVLWQVIRYPLDFIRLKFAPKVAERTTVLLVMQVEDQHTALEYRRDPLRLFKRGLVRKSGAEETVPARIEIGHRVAKEFAERTNGIPQASFSESLFNIPSTAHLLGGVPIGESQASGVVNPKFEVHGYPGLFVVDGSIVPANPGLNPSLTITALAEYAMSNIPSKDDDS